MKLTDVFFCDDIRFETKNKLSLMGLYHDRMVYPKNVQWPIPARVATLLRFKLENESSAPKHFELKFFIKDKELMFVKGEIHVNESHETANLVINADGVMLEAGDLGYLLKIFDQDSKELLSVENKHALKVMAE